MLTALAAALPLLCLGQEAGSQNRAKPAEYDKGALYGSVIDTTTGKPLRDATVAILRPDGKVLAWTRTNSEGKYAIAADTIHVLHLRPSHRRGLLEEICRGVGNIMMAPVKVAVGAVSRPGDTVKSALEASILGNPAPITRQVATSLTDRVKLTPANAEKGTRQAVCTEVFSERQTARKEKKPGLCAGELSLAVTAPGYKGLKGAAGAYWLEPPVYEKNRQKFGVQAWLETVKLAPTSVAAKKSEVADEALLLTDPVIEPALAPAGSDIHISVRLKNPVGFSPKVRVFAREKIKDTVVELTAANPKDPELYTGVMTLDKSLHGGDTQISIGVLRTEPLEVKIPATKQDPLLRFAARLDELEAGKPFEYDPRIFACENRLDVTITVLDPHQGTSVAGDGASVPPPPGKTAAAAPTAVPDPPGKAAPAVGPTETPASVPAPPGKTPAPTAPPGKGPAPAAPSPGKSPAPTAPSAPGTAPATPSPPAEGKIPAPPNPPAADKAPTPSNSPAAGKGQAAAGTPSTDKGRLTAAQSAAV